ncbi:GNAT family N-acetyltransferase [Actinomadura sediminis]|uniref:GNAT family N-acetyltransferase n=1 Tax=Actinomadura sediminis TaxID=1038904 RepID=A0ABW3EQQ9_9ACTN
MGTAVRTATEDDIAKLAVMLGRAFQDDPVARFIEPDDDRRRRVLPRIYAMQLRGFFIGQGATEVIVLDGTVKAGALWNPPGRWRTPAPTQIRQFPTVLRLAGRNIGRLVSVFGAVEKAHPAEPHWYLAELGTAPDSQRTGLGRLLLNSRLARCDVAGEPAYLETPEVNVPYYERFGFQVKGEISIPRGGPTVYPMWRPAGGA